MFLTCCSVELSMILISYLIRAKIEDFLKADDDEQKELILENTSPFQRKLLFGHGKKKYARLINAIFNIFTLMYLIIYLNYNPLDSPRLSLIAKIRKMGIESC